MVLAYGSHYQDLFKFIFWFPYFGPVGHLSWIAQGYVTKSWGYGATLMFHHWILCCTPWENAQYHAEKCDSTHIWPIITSSWPTGPT